MLGYLAYDRVDYWIQSYFYLLSFGIFAHDQICVYFRTKVGTMMHMNLKLEMYESILTILYNFEGL